VAHVVEYLPKSERLWVQTPVLQKKKKKKKSYILSSIDPSWSFIFVILLYVYDI
jgi:hypothetical protein